MPRKAVAVLTGKEVSDLIKEARATRAPARDISIGGCEGLTLRLTPTAAVYSIRFRHDGEPLRIRLGDAGDWTPAQARSVGGAARRHVEEGAGVPDPAWIGLKRAAFEAKAAKGEPVAVPNYMPRNRAPETWTYRQARQAWVSHLKAEAESPAQVYRPDTVRNYKSVIGCPAMRALDDRYVSRITAPDVAEAVAGLVKEGKRSQARDVVRVSKRFWAWMAEPGQVRMSGAARKVMEELKAPKLGDTKARQHFPFVSEVAIMLSIAQTGILVDSVGFAVELLVFTAQRRLSICKARVEEFLPWPEREGWGIWWEGHRKVARGSPTARDPFAGSHAIPLPPVAWRRAQAYIERTTEDALAAGRLRSPWMFPMVRARRVGDRTDWHLHEDTLSHDVAAMPGCRATPHDVRRAFASYLQEEAGISSNLVGLVMDHVKSDLLHVTDNDGITRRYTRDEMLALKAKPMEAWVEALRLARIEVELPDSTDLKAQLVAEHMRQRGIKDVAAEAARRRAASARAYAEGRTTKQRQRRTPEGTAGSN
jgi:integrase